jgi:hypothetical protein
MNGRENERNRRKRKVVLCISFTLFVAAVCVTVLLWQVWKQRQASEQDRTKVEVDPAAQDYVDAPREGLSASSGVAIPGWGSITIPANQTSVAVDFYNPEANDGQYYLTYEMRLADGDELLYSSGLIPPGKHIQQITLSRALDAGNYDVVLHVQPYRMNEELSPTNNADMNTELIVQ